MGTFRLSFNVSLFHEIKGLRGDIRGRFCWLPIARMRFMMRSISEIESGSASAPIFMHVGLADAALNLY